MINIDDLMRYLNLDKESKKRLIESNQNLKQYSDQILKRKPKRLDTPLAKKLENPRHKLTEQYFSLKEMEKIFEITEFDELRKLTYLVEYNRIKKITDPEDQNRQLSRLYSQIKQDIEYFIGHEEKGDESKNLSLEDQIQQSIMLGSKEFNKQ